MFPRKIYACTYSFQFLESDQMKMSFNYLTNSICSLQLFDSNVTLAGLNSPIDPITTGFMSHFLCLCSAPLCSQGTNTSLIFALKPVESHLLFFFVIN